MYQNKSQRLRSGLVNWIVFVCVSIGPTSANEPLASQPGQVRKLANLANGNIRESSGLAYSRRQPGVLWTHNDSGDESQIYAFDLQGKDLGTFRIPDSSATDWEDMASFVLDGTPCLLLADVGDNQARRERYSLYLVEEPDTEQSRANRPPIARLLQTVQFQYENGSRNCESVGFDTTSRTVFLLTKQSNPLCEAYALEWPDRAESSRLEVAQFVAKLQVQAATAMDISSDGRRAIVATYGPGFEFVRGKVEGWDTAFRRPGRPIFLPFRRQGESICYGPDAKTIYATSEKRPTPLFSIPNRQVTE